MKVPVSRNPDSVSRVRGQIIYLLNRSRPESSAALLQSYVSSGPSSNTLGALSRIVHKKRNSTMAPLKLMLVATMAGVAGAFAPSSHVSREATQLHESFGLGVGEDTYENQPDLLKGEQEYKQYMNKVDEDNMLNRKVRNTKRILLIGVI